jgi:predicted nucleic acid-binding protein
LPRLALDAESLVAAAIAPDSSFGQIVMRCVRGEETLVVSRDAIEDARDTLNRATFRRPYLTQAEANEWIVGIESIAVFLDEPQSGTGEEPRPRRLIDSARGHVDCIITQDRNLLSQSTDELPIMTPSDWLNRVGQR